MSEDNLEAWYGLVAEVASTQPESSSRLQQWWKKMIHGRKDVQTWLPWLSTILLVSWVARWGLTRALDRYHHADDDIPWLRGQSLVPLTSDWSLIVRVVTHTRGPALVLPDQWQDLWSLLERSFPTPTVLRFTVVPKVQGSLSFVVLPQALLKEQTLRHMIQTLKDHKWLPAQAPSRGPLSGLKFLSFDTSPIDGRLHPEVLITVVV